MVAGRQALVPESDHFIPPRVDKSQAFNYTRLSWIGRFLFEVTQVVLDDVRCRTSLGIRRL